eukprot:1167793-Prymnesium_polylepis.1
MAAADAAGALLEPKDIELGELVQARDFLGYWCNGTVVQKEGRGHNTSVTIKFKSFSARWNEKFKSKDRGVRARQTKAAQNKVNFEARWGVRTDGLRDDGRWDVDSIVAVRGRKNKMYKIRWQGWEEEDDSWEPAKSVDAGLIADFEEQRDAERKAAAEAAAPAGPAKVPFSVELAAQEEPAIQQMRITDTNELIADIGSEAAARVGRAKQPMAELKIYFAKPVGAGAFVALRNVLMQAALEADPTRDPETVVTKITVQRRGARPTDTFT